MIFSRNQFFPVIKNAFSIQLRRCCKPGQIVSFEGIPDIQDSDINHALKLSNPDIKLIQPRIVIIGAGLAGLSTAARLSEKGMNNYVILEANERPGGRIHSTWFGDTPVELGAQWQPNKKNFNPVYDFIFNEDPPRPAAPGAINPRGLLDSAISSSMNYACSVGAYQKFRQIENEAHSLYCYGGSKQHGSLLNFISIRVQQELHHFPDDCQQDAARVMFGLAHMLTARSNGDTSLLSKDNIGCFMNMPGGMVRVPLGTLGLIAPILKKIQGEIRYCKPVSHILWGVSECPGTRAAVHTCDGEVFPADYVVVTIPYGTLCNYHQRLFCPCLPAAKLDAMRCLCTGHCNKIYCEYARPHYYWHNDLLNMDFHCDGDIKHRSQNFSGITTIELVPNSERVLCFCVTGDEAVMIEGISDCDLAESLTNTLRRLTGNFSIPYPQNILKSAWSCDPFFHGAFSFDQHFTQGEAQKAMSQPVPGPNEPVPPILLFAGEATVPGHNATLSGARLSGVREAERLFRLTAMLGGPPETSKDVCRCPPSPCYPCPPCDPCPCNPCPCNPCPCNPCPPPCTIPNFHPSKFMEDPKK